MADNFLVAFAIDIIAYRERIVKGFLKSFLKNFFKVFQIAFLYCIYYIIL